MNGDALATKIRRIVRDFTSPTRGGQFWSDAEIRLALNASQDVFVNFCLKNNLFYLLDRLFTFIRTSFSTTNPNALPANYLHYASAVVWDAGDHDFTASRFAQIHMGGDADKYMWVDHDSCNIIGTDLHFMSSGVWSPGLMFYYKRPSFIGLTSLGDSTRADFNDTDFETSVYNDIFCYHASILLGMKETRNKRNVLVERHMVEKLVTTPVNIENFLKGEDLPVQKYEDIVNKMRGQNV